MDSELLARLQHVCAAENVTYESSGLEAIIFTAEGDMRNALNALQSTVSGFGLVSSDNVFKVCDQPHPLKIRSALDSTRRGDMAAAQQVIMNLWGSGYAATDIITTLFRVTRSSELPEQIKLEYIREIGFTHMRIAEGLNSQLQLLGCIARLCILSR
jgi:replication factor C subunit 2/4